MCKKQTSVSHSSTEAEIISLDAGFRMDGIPAPTLWDLVIEVFHSVPNRTDGPKREPRGNPSAVVKPNMHNSIPVKHTNVIPTNIDHIPSNTTHSGSSAMLYVFEDNEAVIKMIIKGRSPTMRHVSRTTELLWIGCLTGLSWTQKVQSKYTDTKNQLAAEIPEWLQEFRENLVDDEIPSQGGSHASSSHEASLEPTPTRREDLFKHSVYTHFPKDRNCEICQRTKITRAPCRRRMGGVIPRAENFGDLITADHKILSEGCESRNNHRYAVVVQDLATQWIQAYPCKTKTTQETQRSLQKFLEPNRKPKVIYTDNSLEFGKACEDLS